MMKLAIVPVLVALVNVGAHAYNHQDRSYGEHHRWSGRANDDPAFPPLPRPSGMTVIPENPVPKPASCGAKNATVDITPWSGPNGLEDFLNCGLPHSGWTPPTVLIPELVTVELTPDGPFAPCAPVIDLFARFGQQFGLPPILLAGFAMERSACDVGKVGVGGEQGIMQLTPDQCEGAPGGNCQDTTYNIQTFAQAFVNTLNLNYGNIIQTTGEFAKWYVGLTAASATCESEINLDFLQQFLNGWLQNVDPKTPVLLGKYFNLDLC